MFPLELRIVFEKGVPEWLLDGKFNQRSSVVGPFQRPVVRPPAYCALTLLSEIRQAVAVNPRAGGSL